MANYRIPKSIATELKINKALFLTDLLILVGLLLFTFVSIQSSLIHSSLTWVFGGFMVIVAGLMIIRPATNPKKRMYEAIYLSIRKRKDTYVPIDYDVDEDDDLEEGDK